MEEIISVRGLSKSFNGFKAVDSLDLSVYKGDVYGFLGPNGAGKSTTIRMLLSLIKADQGTIRIFNKDLSLSRSEIVRRTGCIVEKPDFYRYLSARKNLEILSLYSGIVSSRKKTDEILEFVGLAGKAEQKVSGFSHGMKQRLGLAQALIHDPDLIILDEPTTGLDPQGIIDIRELILYLSREKGKTIFLSSHILHELELVANRIAILNRGKRILEGEMQALLNEKERIVSLQTDQTSAVYDLLKNSQFSGTCSGFNENFVLLNMQISQIPKVLQFLSEHGASVYGVESRRKLEDLFLKLTESSERMAVPGFRK